LQKLSLASRRIAQDFRLQLLVLIATRLLVVVARVATLLIGGGPSDLVHFYGMMRYTDQGLYPYIHFWVEYPPVYPWLLVGLYRFSELFGQGGLAAGVFYGIASLVFVACEAGVFILIYRISLLIGNADTARRSTLVYLACSLPIYIWSGWFDPMPTLLFLGGLYLLLTGRERLSALGIGLGVMSKIFPGLLIPLALCALPTLKRKLRYALISGGVILGIALPFIIIDPTMLIASARNMMGRPSWESFWAVLEGYYWYGEVAPVSLRTDPGAALVTSHPSTIPWLPVTIVFGLLFATFYRRFWGTTDRGRIVAGTGYTLALLLLYFKGYSPQFLNWFIPLVAILLPNRQGAFYAGLLTLSNVLEIGLYFSLFPDQNWLLTLAVLCRTAVWILFSWDAVRWALGERPQWHPAFNGGPGIAPRQMR
jgi:hypothetical protein